MRPGILSISVLLLSLMAGCSSPAAANGPPEITYTRDICLECDMIISEPRFAAAYRLDDGEAKAFDGVGEMVKHGRRTDDFARVSFAWAHDFNTEEWVLVEDAFFVAGGSVITPMGHGIVAFATEVAAVEPADQLGGMVMRWPEVRELPLSERGLLGHHHEEHAEGHSAGTNHGPGTDHDPGSHDG